MSCSLHSVSVCVKIPAVMERCQYTQRFLRWLAFEFVKIKPISRARGLFKKDDLPHRFEMRATTDGKVKGSSNIYPRARKKINRIELLNEWRKKELLKKIDFLFI